MLNHFIVSGTLQGGDDETNCRSQELSCFPQGPGFVSAGEVCPASKPMLLAFHMLPPVICLSSSYLQLHWA